MRDLEVDVQRPRREIGLGSSGRAWAACGREREARTPVGRLGRLTPRPLVLAKGLLGFGTAPFSLLLSAGLALVQRGGRPRLEIGSVWSSPKPRHIELARNDEAPEVAKPCSKLGSA